MRSLDKEKQYRAPFPGGDSPGAQGAPPPSRPDAQPAGPMILCENLVKIYKTKDIEVMALQGLDLTVERGEYMAIVGNSGSGKSTLLNMLGCLDTPSAGRVEVDGRNILQFTPAQTRDYKLRRVGFVWQNHARNLIPYLTALENVQLPMMLAGRADPAYAGWLLEQVGLGGHRHKRMEQLSGGEQQRVAIAIALANRPGLVLADEPTGAVDSKTTVQILDIFRRFNQELGTTMVLVTHDRLVSKYVDRVVAIRDGRTSSEFIKRSYSRQLQELADAAKAEAFAAQLEAEQSTHEEFAVLDRAGRLQLPADYLQELALHGSSRVRVALEDGRIVLTNPAAEPDSPKEPDLPKEPDPPKGSASPEEASS